MLINKKIVLIVTLITIFLAMTTVAASDSNQSDDNVVTNENDVSIQDVQTLNDISSDDKNNNKNIYQKDIEQFGSEKYSVDNLNSENNEKSITGTDQYNLPVIYLDASYFANNNNQLNFNHKRIVLMNDFINMGNIKITADTGEVSYIENEYMVNTTFTVSGTNFHLNNFKINNSGAENDENAILIYNSSDALVYNANIIYNKSVGEVHGINIYNSTNVSVEKSIVNITGEPQYMGWTNIYPWQGGVKVSGITYINSSNSLITNSTVYVQNNTSPYIDAYTTMEGITVRDHSHYIDVTDSIINVTGGRNNYGTTVSDESTNITFNHNIFNITGERYVCGLQYDNSKNCSAINNNVSLLSELGTIPINNDELISYGIILTAWSNGGTLNSTVRNNTIVSTSNIGYGLEIYDATYSNITENNFTLDGIKVMGIGSYHGHNTNITENIMHLSGTDGTTNYIYEVIQPDNQGIFINGSTNNIVNQSTICVHNSGNTITDIYAIKSTSTLSQLKNNQVCVCNANGQKALADSISASATSESGNSLYTCPQCNGNCISEVTSSQTHSISLLNTKKSLKTESQIIVITAENFNDYVTGGMLNDNVNEGDTLDFQGIFYGTRFGLTITKPVNIISSTKDAYICLDGTNTDFFGVNVGSSFTILRNGSGTNVTGIYFNNTQVFVKNAENITINNITVNNEDLPLGSGVGVTSIRDNSSNVKVLNSHFRTKDNGGHSTLVCGWANNVLIENCTIEAEGMVGNLFYATTYNVEGIEAAEPYVNNNITFRNNHIDGLKVDVAVICFAVALEGKGHVIENNVIEYYGSGITSQWGYGNISDITIRNNTIPYGKSTIGIFNGTIVEDNYINFTSLEDAIVKNNNFNTVEIYANVTFTDNVVERIYNAYHPDLIENVTITNNFIGSLTVDANAKNFYIANNTIYSPESYAVTIKKDTTNITLENNFIASKDKNSTEAINATGDYTSINNIGIVVYNLTDDDVLPYNYIVEEGKLYYEESNWGNTYYFDGVNNSVAYLNINKGGSINFLNQPSIIIMNASNIEYLQPQPPFTHGISYFARTSLLINSYLPNTSSYIVDSLDWYTCKVDVLFNIVNSTFKESSSVGTQNEIKFFNVSFIEDVHNNTTDILNTSILVDTEKIVKPSTKVDLNFYVNATDAPVTNGKIVLFDKIKKYGEFDIVDGVASFNTSFENEGNYSFIAYYVGEGNYNNSNVKFNLTVKELLTVLNIEPVDITVGDLITLRVNVTNELGDKITGGKVVFKINGKTLKDASGKTIYAKVVDGVATVESQLSDLSNCDNVTIKVSYTGTSNFKSATNVTTLNITNAMPILTTEDVTATAGSTVTLTATISGSDSEINNGKIVFKINGKTVKDSNGKVIYAKVVNGQVSVEYTLPNSMKANTYDLTAVYISSTYDRIEDSKSLTVN